MNIIHEVNVDLVYDFPTASLPIQVMQGDTNSRSIAVTLTNHGVAWQVPQQADVCVDFCRADGTGGVYDTLEDGSKAYTVSENVVTISLAPQVLTVAGAVQLSVSLKAGETVISTFPLEIDVQGLPSRAESQRDDESGCMLPPVTQEDNGKFLCVVDGAWSAVEVEPSGEAALYTGEVEVE